MFFNLMYLRILLLFFVQAIFIIVAIYFIYFCSHLFDYFNYFNYFSYFVTSYIYNLIVIYSLSQITLNLIYFLLWHFILNIQYCKYFLILGQFNPTLSQLAQDVQQMGFIIICYEKIPYWHITYVIIFDSDLILFY